MATRVFQLAKELGVTSKSILEKCRAEGLDLKNHMAALSAGLEATIREWFSADENLHSAVETAEAVDLEDVRIKREAAAEAEAAAQAAVAEAMPESRAQAEEQTVAPEVEPGAEPEAEPLAEASKAVEEPLAEPVAGTPVSEPERTPEQPPAPAGAETAAEPVETEAPAEEPAVAEQETETPEPQPEQARPAAEAESEQAEALPSHVKPNQPDMPEVVGPAGPMLVPKPAQLQGPKVVRVERPESAPVPRRRPRPAQTTPDSEEPSSRPPAIRPAPAAGEKATEESKRKATRRSPRRRGGRGAEVQEGIREWRDRDLNERRERLAAATGGGLRRHRASVSRPAEVRQHGGPAEIEEPITIKSFSAATGIKSAMLIRKLMGKGIMATVTQTISAETAEELALEFEVELHIKRRETYQEQLDKRMASRGGEGKAGRPPVVTFLGHVDHGKTSLLDRIRQASVVKSESGGITQHIGSYRYEKDDQVVAFLDTPGHEAFTQMRSRGANMTDVVVLVVAADDGVMPQTVEAISHAKAAGVPIVVALNKIDVPNANVNRVMTQLSEHDLQPREWGGQVEVIQTSAMTGEGIESLVETLTLEAELLELKADPDADATGSVIESEMDPGRGVVARLLVQDGTLRVGDIVTAGPGYGRVRQMLNDRGEDIEEAGPSTPVEVSGLDEVPTAGDRFYVVKELSEAKNIAEEIRTEKREKSLATKQAVTLDNLFAQINAGEMTELPLIVKADVQGSVEVLIDSLNKLSTDEVRVKLLHVAVGGISGSDVLLAEASGAIILGFHVVPDAAAREMAERAGVDIRLYRVIYELIDEVRQAMQGLLEPELKEEVLGHAEVRDVFKVTRVGTIAGCYVTDGSILRNSKIRVTRDGIVIEDERQLESLKRFKDDAREVRNGMECGMKIVGYDDVKVGDILEAYRTVEVARKL